MWWVNSHGVSAILFINQMGLIDCRAWKMAPEADEALEMNFVAASTAGSRPAGSQGISLREAGAIRGCVSNASGSYSSNVNLAVENSHWERRRISRRCTSQQNLRPSRRQPR